MAPFAIEWCRHSLHDLFSHSAPIDHRPSTINHQPSNRLLIGRLTFDFRPLPSSTISSSPTLASLAAWLTKSLWLIWSLETPSSPCRHRWSCRLCPSALELSPSPSSPHFSPRPSLRPSTFATRSSGLLPSTIPRHFDEQPSTSSKHRISIFNDSRPSTLQPGCVQCVVSSLPAPPCTLTLQRIDAPTLRRSHPTKT